MKTRRIVEVFALLALCAAGVALLWGPPEAITERVRAEGRYSISGVVPGMPRSQVVSLLGQGRQLQVVGGVESTVYGHYEDRDSPELQQRWVVVHWDGETVGAVEGSHLHRDGAEVLGRGWKLEDAVKLLGPERHASAIPQRGVSSVFLYSWPEVTATVSDGRLTGFVLGRDP